MSSEVAPEERFSEKLRTRLSKFMSPDQATRLVQLCSHDKVGLLGAGHAEIIASLAGVSIDKEQLDDLSSCYVLLNGYYFLLDSAVDGDCEDTTELVWLTPLLASAITLLLQWERDEVRSSVSGMLLRRIFENAQAMLAEDRGAEPLCEDYSLSRLSSIGRSNTCMLLFDTLCFLGGKPPDPKAARLLEDLLIVIQRVDDLADWREDLGAKRWTPFLQAASRRASRTDEAGLERFILLSGEYEREASSCIHELDRLISIASGIDGGQPLTEFLTSWRGIPVSALRQIIINKLGARNNG